MHEGRNKNFDIEVICTCKECGNQWGDLLLDEDPEQEDEGLEDEMKVIDYDDSEDEAGEDKEVEDGLFCPYCGSTNILQEEVR